MSHTSLGKNKKRLRFNRRDDAKEVKIEKVAEGNAPTIALRVAALPAEEIKDAKTRPSGLKVEAAQYASSRS